MTARIVIVAGHLRSENLTLEGLCPDIRNDETVRRLRASTGSRGERDYTAYLAGALADAVNATKSGIEARATDCTYSRELYVDWHPAGVVALHFHRDPNGRAMFAIPQHDDELRFHDDEAHRQSRRLEARIEGAYAARTGIPLTDDLTSLNMTQLYTWCYIPADAWAVICELGNANVDTANLYNGANAIIGYLRDCLLEHLDVVAPATQPPRQRATDVVPVPAAVTKETIAASLEGLARQLRELPT